MGPAYRRNLINPHPKINAEPQFHQPHYFSAAPPYPCHTTNSAFKDPKCHISTTLTTPGQTRTHTKKSFLPFVSSASRSIASSTTLYRKASVHIVGMTEQAGRMNGIDHHRLHPGSRSWPGLLRLTSEMSNWSPSTGIKQKNQVQFDHIGAAISFLDAKGRIGWTMRTNRFTSLDWARKGIWLSGLQPRRSFWKGFHEFLDILRFHLRSISLGEKHADDCSVE